MRAAPFLAIGLLGVNSLAVAVEGNRPKPATELKPTRVDEGKIAKLIEALEDRQHSVRISAMKRLASYGTAAKKAVPALGEVLRGSYKNLGDEAARTLAQIGKASVPN